MQLCNLTPFAATLALSAAAHAQIQYGTSQTLPLQGFQPDWVTAIDIDGDKDRDLAVSSGSLSGTNGPDFVEIFLNQGGTFVAGQVVNVGFNVSAAAMVAADFDGDGDQDLALSLKDVNQVVLLTNNAGFFTAGAGVFVNGLEPRHMVAVDYDRDGDPDLVTSNRDSNNLSLLTNQGGTFFLAGTIATGLEPRYVAAGDMNGDCIDDLVVAVSDSRRVELFSGNGAGGFGAAMLIPVPGNEKPEGVALADIDGDGDRDIVTTVDVNDVGAIALLRNQGGAFLGQLFFTGGISPGAVIAQDLDDDGDIDVAAADEDANSVAALANTGGFFGAASSFGTGANPSHLAASDFDGNGSIDLATANRNTHNVTVLFNATAGGAETYCSAGPNSVGSGARIGRTGSTSIAANGFTLTVNCAAPLQNGVFFYGPDSGGLPFGEGIRCVTGPSVRLSPTQMTDAQGFASRLVDFNSPEAAQISAGSTWCFQFWYRDPAGGGSGFNLSDGLSATFRL